MTIFHIWITFILSFCSLLFKLACKTNVKSQPPPPPHPNPSFVVVVKTVFLGFRAVLKNGSLAAISSERCWCWVKLTSATNFASKACKIPTEKKKKKKKKEGGKKNKEESLRAASENKTNLICFLLGTSITLLSSNVWNSTKEVSRPTLTLSKHEKRMGGWVYGVGRGEVNKQVWPCGD